jgi:hypothetical protein
MAISDRMVLLVRALSVFALNAVLGLAATVFAGAGQAVAGDVTFGWLVPMTAVCALALAVATLARSAIAGAAAGMAGWALTVLSGRVASGQFTAAVTRAAFMIPYLIVAVGCAAVAAYATRIPRGTPR